MNFASGASQRGVLDGVSRQRGGDPLRSVCNGCAMHRHFTLIILVGMIAGLAVGWAAHDTMSVAGAASLAGYFDLVTGVFINLIKMIIAPLIFATLTSGVARMEGGGRAGRVGGRTIAWFLIAGVIALRSG